MEWFCWDMRAGDIPHHWDLRRRGWQLCTCRNDEQQQCSHVTLVDGSGLPDDDHDLPSRRRLIVLGVGESSMRARLLALGCGDVLDATTGLTELEMRARRVAAAATSLPRAVHIGPLMLDLLHRDARHDTTWLGLHPREFGLLWRLAEEPGTSVTRRTLLHDVWRIHHEPDTNSVEVHVSRLRGKLALAGCANLVRTASTGGYRLEVHDGIGQVANSVPNTALSP